MPRLAASGCLTSFWVLRKRKLQLEGFLSLLGSRLELPICGPAALAQPGLEEEEPIAASREEEEHYNIPGRRGALCSIPGSDNLCQSLQPTPLHTGSCGHPCASPRLLPPSRKNEDVAERTSPHTDRETHVEERNFGSEWGRCCCGFTPQFPHVLYRAWGDPASPWAL